MMALILRDEASKPHVTWKHHGACGTMGPIGPCCFSSSIYSYSGVCIWFGKLIRPLEFRTFPGNKPSAHSKHRIFFRSSASICPISSNDRESKNCDQAWNVTPGEWRVINTVDLFLCLFHCLYSLIPGALWHLLEKVEDLLMMYTESSLESYCTDTSLCSLALWSESSREMWFLVTVFSTRL